MVDSLVADIDANQDEMGGEQRRVFRLVQIFVERPAIAAPVGTKIDQHTLVRARRLLQRRVDVGSGARRVRKDRCGERRSHQQRSHRQTGQHGCGSRDPANREEFLHVCSSLRSDRSPLPWTEAVAMV